MNFRGKFRPKIYLKDVFGFAGHKKNETYGQGYKLNLKRINHITANNRAAATANAEFVIKGNNWFVPHCTPNITQQ